MAGDARRGRVAKRALVVSAAALLGLGLGGGLGFLSAQAEQRERLARMAELPAVVAPPTTLPVLPEDPSQRKGCGRYRRYRYSVNPGLVTAWLACGGASSSQGVRIIDRAAPTVDGRPVLAGAMAGALLAGGGALVVVRRRES
jgi:hypothetical protein